MTFQEIKAHDQAHIMNTYGRSDACIVTGKGALCKDTEGKEYIDFTSGIGVNSLGYLSIDDVVKLADNTENGFCTACFGGGYPTSIPKDGGKDRFECKISEGEKKKNA